MSKKSKTKPKPKKGEFPCPECGNILYTPQVEGPEGRMIPKPEFVQRHYKGSKNLTRMIFVHKNIEEVLVKGVKVLRNPDGCPVESITVERLVGK